MIFISMKKIAIKETTKATRKVNKAIVHTLKDLRVKVRIVAMTGFILSERIHWMAYIHDYSYMMRIVHNGMLSNSLYIELSLRRKTASEQ